MSTIQMTDAASSKIHSIGFDAETNTLAVRFFHGYGANKQAGALYHYANVSTDDYEALLAAESRGRHFRQHIQPFKDRYPYTRIEDAPVAPAASDAERA